MPPPTVFISYSHDSPEHADRVLAFSDRLRSEGVDCQLDQYEPAPPDGWPRWMDKHIRSADFVLMICTETYFCRVMGEEEPGKGLGVKWEGNLIYQHIYQADSTNRRFIPVLFEENQVEHIPTPVQGVTHYRVHTADGYERLYRHLTDQPLVIKPELGKLLELPPRERKTDFLERPVRSVVVSTASLPSTDSYLIGREQKLAALDAAWESSTVILSEAKNLGQAKSPFRSGETLRSAQGDRLPQKTNILSLVAFGGVGKTALVNKWLAQMALDNYRGAERVFGWSFYSQGAAEGKQVAADPFIAAALKWFGDPDPTAGNPWDKGERLAQLIKEHHTLLVLDGLEPLQNPPPVETGRIKDPALRSLLRELARQNAGLVVITTRLSVDDLKDFLGSFADEINLENLSAEAGADYLKHLGVTGSTDELIAASREYDGHALALTLLGSYLKTVYRGDVHKRDQIVRLTDERKHGPDARRVMAAYEHWLKDKPELDILRLMGLFDRPAEHAALEALRKKPAIKGLTERIQKLSLADWRYAVDNLRALRLLADEDPHDPDALDAHPLLREHFGEQLRVSNAKAWREAHSRLYEHYKSSAKEFPDTVDEMTPLYAAVAHGCLAGRYQEAHDDLYRKRTLRGDKYFSTRQLGAFSADLAALSGFFEKPWREPVSGLSKSTKGLVLAIAGFDLRTLGRLEEAAQPTQAALEAAIDLHDLENAARYASTISQIYLTSGEVTQALDYARQSIQLADRSGDAFQRITKRVQLADTLHQAGHLAEAEAALREAEEMQKADQSEFQLLYAFQGFLYCDLLLDQGKYLEVQSRVGQTIEIAMRNKWLLGIALDHLSLGRAHLMQAEVEGTNNYSQATTHLGYAVDGLRQAGAQEFIVRGLLARAELWRVMGALDKARRDLDEAYSIATRGGMRRHEADCHLEYARLFVASGEKDKAREHFELAKKMIEEIGYHRRDVECQRIEQQING